MKTYRIERRVIETGALWWKKRKPMLCIVEKDDGEVFMTCWTNGCDNVKYCNE